MLIVADARRQQMPTLEERAALVGAAVKLIARR